jgi:hypothetical protein
MQAALSRVSPLSRQQRRAAESMPGHAESFIHD